MSEILSGRRSRRTGWLGCALALLIAAPAAAQDFPSRPITMIVAFAAGGYADSVARIIGTRLGERIGQNVVIENRGGAGGNIAGGLVAHASPDGYTLLVTTSSVAVNDAYYKNKVFSASELKAIAIPGGAPETLSVKPDHPAKTLADLIASARGRSLDYASAGVGTSSHVAAAYFFKELAKINTVHVPFQGGAPAINAVMGGHVEVLVGTLPGYAGQFRSGAMRALAVASEKRVPEFPDIPTYGEGGYPGFAAETWVGVFAPARIDDAIAAKLNAAVNEIIKEPATEERLRALSLQTRTRDLAASNAYFRSEVADWAKRVQAVGISAE
ncbi:MAG TPA: tripartite tricarboxylate transporter substrate-binding protein [Xanthobacteraceae bacterium]|nr:tripartite tricarboxylate transporter substrate-binding protein [Xanthobacteraceae bacterium]